MAEKTTWRKCEFASVPSGRLPAEQERHCAVIPFHTHLPVPEQCATCPVPALVAAVQASKEFLESRGVQAAFMLQGLHGGAEPWRKGGKLIDEWLDAALAALPKGEDRG